LAKNHQWLIINFQSKRNYISTKVLIHKILIVFLSWWWGRGRGGGSEGSKTETNDCVPHSEMCLFLGILLDWLHVNSSGKRNSGARFTEERTLLSYSLTHLKMFTGLCWISAQLKYLVTLCKYRWELFLSLYYLPKRIWRKWSSLLLLLWPLCYNQWKETCIFCLIQNRAAEKYSKLVDTFRDPGFQTPFVIWI
jgi:hypothetical protein